MDWFGGNPYLLAIRNELSLCWQPLPRESPRKLEQNTGRSTRYNGHSRSPSMQSSEAFERRARMPLRSSILHVDGAADARYRVRWLCAQLLPCRNLRCPATEPDHSSAWSCLFLLDSLTCHANFPRRCWPRDHSSPSRNCWLHPCLFHGDARRLGSNGFTWSRNRPFGT